MNTPSSANMNTSSVDDNTFMFTLLLVIIVIVALAYYLGDPNHETRSTTCSAESKGDESVEPYLVYTNTYPYYWDDDYYPYDWYYDEYYPYDLYYDEYYPNA